ncbi:MAG: hypothetical protein Q8O95_04555 [bacterium]|nr:hypothetical protein [bacterium]
MQVYSKTNARQNFAALFNAVRYAGRVIGVGRGKIKVGGKILPEVLMVKMPTPDEIEELKKSPLGFDEAMKKWLLEKVASEFGMK